MTSSDREPSLEFPLEHISASSMIKLSSNPLMFKILYKNRDRIETAMGASGVVGKAFHHAMEAFYENSVEDGLKAGTEYLDVYSDAFIKYNTVIKNKQDAIDRFVFAYNSYMNELPKQGKLIACEDQIIEQINVEWRGQRYDLPVPLKGYIDKIVEEDGELVIVDYKTCASFSDPEKVDGAKILQAVEYFFLCYAKYGRPPKKLRYEEVKISKNRDGSPQVKLYEIVFDENDLYFDFYMRFMGDMIRQLNGEAVYLPNVHALFDNDIAIIAYIQRLDQEEEVARRMKEEKVQNITDLLRNDIQRASDMKKLLKAAERSLQEAKNIDYKNMKNSEKIQTKLLEHGMVLKFVDKIEGASVDLYRFTPSIGLKMSRIRNYADDIEQVIGVSGVRMLAPISNSTMVGVEVPRTERSFPAVPAAKGFDIAIGKTVMGEDLRFDIREAPHMLVAGATGSGKSVFLNALIEQLHTVPNSEMILLDPKRVELAHHKDKGVYINNVPDIVQLLKSLVAEMELRYEQLEKAGVKNISATEGMQYKFVVLDEFGELAAQSKKTGAMTNVLRLAQMARACGIHMIIATQRPSTDIITGTIKANFPTKVCFRVSKQVDSRVVIDEVGAEKLLGKGDMLFQSTNGIERLQGYFA